MEYFTAAASGRDGSVAAGPRGSLVIIGNFDGVHRGHQALLADAALDAGRRGLEPVALTFSPHPAITLGRAPPATLTALPRKIELIQRAQPSVRVDVMTFDRAFAAQTPEEFVRRALLDRLAARVVLVGANFRFGRGRAGDFATLGRLGEALGFETRSHPLVGDAEGPWSSTRVREAIARGDLDSAERMLSRPHMLSGVVAQGAKRGRTIGFPTCNLDAIEEALPPFGVYATLVDRVDSSGRAIALARGVANLGVRPTVEPSRQARPNLEVHLFDVDEDLYGAALRVHLIARLREERRFSGLPELKAQIARDAEAARARLAPLTPDPTAGGAFR
ncbi:riboflavin kinase [Sorangium cellulosum]|uniref:Riboflavin biosynthesis protein n=1 Tax=Sorangium cellulosum TaxID=56 RepID=A0A4P2Q8P0_SORCE|nr:riboflavin biosynthesis protein RibF [Sorangium cellulosum]AUX25576.1 riboflavin kinase [Sorangium cellulosum]